MLKLTRRKQQSVVVFPKDDPNKTMMIRVVETLPGTSTIGFDGDGYSVVRGEIFNGGLETENDNKNTN